MKFLVTLALLAAGSGSTIGAQRVTMILDRDGDGLANRLDRPVDLAVDESGNVFVAGYLSDNVFKVAPDGAVTEIIDESGDGLGNELRQPSAIDVFRGHVYVASRGTSRVFRVAPDGSVTKILGEPGQLFFAPSDLVVSPNGFVFVTSSNRRVFRIRPDGTSSAVIGPAGDGVHPMAEPTCLAISQAGNLYVGDTWHQQKPFTWGENVFKRDTNGVVTRILWNDWEPGGYPVASIQNLAVDDAEVVFLGDAIGFIVQITPDGTISSTSVSPGLVGLGRVALDPAGNVFVTFTDLFVGEFATRIHRTGVMTELLDASGDGQGNLLDGPFALATDARGNVYVSGYNSDNVFKIEVCSPHSAFSAMRNGSGANPVGFAEATPPEIGALWSTTVDASAPGTVATLVAISRGGPIAGVGTPMGELLCAPPFLPADVGLGAHALEIPYDCALVGRKIAAQAATLRLAPLRLQLQNALDATIGTQASLEATPVPR